MDKDLHIIEGVSTPDKTKFVSLLKSRNYRQVGILETPGECEYSVRSHIDDFDGSHCDCGKAWTIVYGVRKDLSES